MTTTIKDGTLGIENVVLFKDHSFNLVFTKEKGNIIRMLGLRNPFQDGKSTGNYSDEDYEKWTLQLKKLFDYNRPSEDSTFYIEYDDFVKYFKLINICIPLKPINCQVMTIPKERADKHNVIIAKLEKKGVFSVTIEIQTSRFHKEITEEKKIIENLILAKIDKAAKKLMCVDSCFNEALFSGVEPGEYLCIFCLDYNSSEVKDIRPYNIHIGCTTNYKIASVDPD